jgi:mRNA interferase MazF
MNRGGLHWAHLPEGFGRRPVVILSRDVVLPVRDRVTVAPVSRTIREIRSEVPVGEREGLPRDSVINTDEILTIPKRRLDPDPIGTLGPVKLRELDTAIHYALDLRD